MPNPSREHPGPWVVQETINAFRILDADKRLLAEVPFATRSGGGLTRSEAREMAEKMVQAGEVLTSESLPGSASRNAL